MNESTEYHKLAKDAGNRLRAYILSMSSAATGVLFIMLVQAKTSNFTSLDKCLLLITIISFVSTVFLSLYELRIDAQRFFSIAKEYEKEESERNWTINEKLKNKRLVIINLSYVMITIAILSLSSFLIIKILQ